VLVLLATLGAGVVSAQPLKLNIVHPLPPAPPWLEGYEVRWPVRVLGEAAKQAAQTVIATLPTGGILRPDASDLAVQAATGELLQLRVLSHDPAGDTIVQFKRRGDDLWYWVYGVGGKSAKPSPRGDAKDAAFHEGLYLEQAKWVGPNEALASWAKVRELLVSKQAAPIVANAVVAEVIQGANPVVPNAPQESAVSYRGYFRVKKGGTHSFFVNADEASFLFIDDFKVFERPGADNTTLYKAKLADMDKLAGKVDLKAGVHAFEVHHVVGSNPKAAGQCFLLWTTPEQPKFAFMRPPDFVPPLYGRVAAAERMGGAPALSFVHGLDDLVESNGLKLFLVRFEAQCSPAEEDQLRWDFGDGTMGKGRSVVHVYFQEKSYDVTLHGKPGSLYRRTMRLWPEPGEMSPLSLERGVQALAALEWQKLPAERLRQVFTFLQTCRQPSAAPLLDAVAQHLLAQPDLDLDARAEFLVARLDALAQQGRAAEAFKVAAEVAPQFARAPALQVRLQIAVAALYQYHQKDAAAASKIYKDVIETHGRTEHPNLRLAAVRWGDLFAETGDLARAAETYRLAATLGGEKLSAGGVTDASTRGALLRIAEQNLRSGQVGASRQLLEKLELEHPGRRLDGLYCFLRAETGRLGGRYEEALRHYEMIFKLPQWAGYKDRAVFGIADTYLRLGELDKARKWLGDLKEAYPKFYEEHKAAELDKQLDERLLQLKTGNNLTAFTTGFEPDEEPWFGEPSGFAFVRAPGLRGPHVALMDVYPRDVASFEHNCPLVGLTPGATYWGELWYRDEVRPLTPPGADMHCNMHLFDLEKKATQTTAQQMMPRATFRQWHKLSFKLKAPVTDCLLKINFMNMSGAIHFDDLSLRLVTDRQLDDLVHFQEEGKAQ
jgi:tetratricopeptide (TPR) repeat protein